jgi:hypothetical protein
MSNFDFQRHTPYSDEYSQNSVRLALEESLHNADLDCHRDARIIQPARPISSLPDRVMNETTADGFPHQSQPQYGSSQNSPLLAEEIVTRFGLAALLRERSIEEISNACNAFQYSAFWHDQLMRICPIADDGPSAGMCDRLRYSHGMTANLSLNRFGNRQRLRLLLWRIRPVFLHDVYQFTAVCSALYTPKSKREHSRLGTIEHCWWLASS